MPAPTSIGVNTSVQFLEALDQELKDLRSRLVHVFAKFDNHGSSEALYSATQLEDLERKAPIVFSEGRFAHEQALIERLTQMSFGGRLYTSAALADEPLRSSLHMSPRTPRLASSLDASMPVTPRTPINISPRDVITADGSVVPRIGPRLKSLEAMQPESGDSGSDVGQFSDVGNLKVLERVGSAQSLGSMMWSSRGSRQSSDKDFDTVEIRTDTPVGRWRHLYLRLMLPDRVRPAGNIFQVHPCWSSFLVMLRKNSGDCRKEYSDAMAKISLSRKDHFRKARDFSGMTMLLHLISPHSMITHPHSRKRMAWVLLSFIFLLIDAVMLPIGAVFDHGQDEYFDFYMLLGIFFWSVDIVLSFFTGRYVYGVLEMRPRRIARAYMRTWLCFDLLMVLLDISLFLVDVSIHESDVTSFGQAFKSVRVIRLIRLLRLGKLQIVLREALSINNKGVMIFSGIIKTTLVYVIYLNFLACVWYGIGQSSESGWTNNCQSESHCYFAAAHWAVTQLHGTSNVKYDTTGELAFASVALFFGMLLFAYFLGRSTHAVAHFIASDKLQMRQTWSVYTKNHRLNSTLAHRVLSYIDACDLQVDLGQQLQRERDMLQHFAYALRAEVLEAARKPLLASITILHDMTWVSPRILTSLCAEACTSLFCLCGEVIFALGEICTHWRILETGVMVYLNAEEHKKEFKDSMTAFLSDASEKLSSHTFIGKGIMELSSKKNIGNIKALKAAKGETFEVVMAHAASGRKAEAVMPGKSISEMVLWTSWIHTGELLATSDSVILQMTLETFYSVLKARTAACLLAAAYAHKYVKHLTVLEEGVSDLLEYVDVEEEELDFTYLSETHEHVIFLSHYKAEAGTEATLLRESLQLLLDDGVGLREFAVFLDSEDLADLADLKMHVINSRNLVLLLTPGVLSRPWCLMEIVTALNHGVNLVPVEIQRPGLFFSYPDEEYYRKLRNGELFDQKVLIDDVTYEDVENALRFLFMQIALPFSPHKSKGVRDAELHDIVRRCLPNFLPASPASRRGNSSDGLETHYLVNSPGRLHQASGVDET